jgi:hypothetical protein
MAKSPTLGSGSRSTSRQGVLRLGVEVVAMTESPYLMSNAHPETAARFDGLERTLDPVSIGHLSRLGVNLGACLEIGTGVVPSPAGSPPGWGRTGT